MKRIFFIIIIFVIIRNINAQTTINGILDSTVSMTVNDGDFSFGIEEFANIRFQSRLRDNRAVIYGAVNLIAAAGSYANDIKTRAEELENLGITAPAGFISTPYIIGENYIAGIELERLFFRLNFENANFDTGLFRLPFGYGQIWSPSDFLNPKNPLKPDARPRGVLGSALSVFTKKDLKIVAFTVTPRDPFFDDGSGILAGFSAENHWERASAQMLYSFEAPIEDGSKYGIHRAGLSIKADAEVGLILDMLYTYDHEARTELDGLSLSAGADYSFLNGKLLVIAEYLYNGENSSTALIMPNRNYIYSGFTWMFNDFTNINIALISCLDKVGFTPIITFNYDLFQGAVLTITTLADIEHEIYTFSARLRLRF